MTYTHNQSKNTLTSQETLIHFTACITDFIALMDNENTCIQEHDTNGLTQLLPLKKEISNRYEQAMVNVEELLSSHSISKDDAIRLSHMNQELMRKSAENYAYLENAQEYSQRLLDIVTGSLNQLTRGGYTAAGTIQNIKSNKPMTLSRTF